jgi:putative hydrolase of the HAD superfamily
VFIFDMGDVVSFNNDVVQAVADTLGLSAADFLSRVGGAAQAMTTGRLSPEDFWRSFSRETGIRVSGDPFARLFEPVLDRKVVDLVVKARARGRAVVGTNTIASHFEVHRKLGHYDYFDRIYASHLMGVAKPDHVFYEHILGEEGCGAGESLFIDDREENVRAASRLGMEVLRFTDADTLAAGIERYF